MYRTEAAKLIILSGLPGVGKTAIAKVLARKMHAVHLRIDTIEQAIKRCRKEITNMDDTGYVVAYKVAEDNLKLGLSVIADSVNPIEITRKAWLEVGEKAEVQSVEIEVICSKPDEHRKRVETRVADIESHKLPSWKDVSEREYHPWTREHLIVDTSGKSVEKCVDVILEYVRS